MFISLTFFLVYVLVFILLHILLNTCFWEALRYIMGFPCGAVVKNLPANSGDMGLIPGSGISLGGRHGRPLQYSCLENPMDRGAWWASVYTAAELDTNEVPEHAHTQGVSCLSPAGLCLGGWVIVRQWSWTRGCLWKHCGCPHHGLGHCRSQFRSHCYAHCFRLGALVVWRLRPVPKALIFHWVEAPPQNTLMIPRSFFCICLNWTQE